MTIRRRWTGFMVLLLALLLLLGCNGGGLEENGEDEDKEDEIPPILEEASVLQVAGWAEAVQAAHHPLLQWPDGWSHPLMQLLHRPILTVCADGRFEGSLASVRTESSGAALRIMFDRGSLWHDEEPVRAEDVVLALETLLHPDFDGSDPGTQFDAIRGVIAYRNGDSDGIDGLRITDDGDLYISLDQPSLRILWSLSRLTALPAHRAGNMSVQERRVFLTQEPFFGTGDVRWPEDGGESFVTLSVVPWVDSEIDAVVWQESLDPTPAGEPDVWFLTAAEMLNLDVPEGYQLHRQLGSGFDYLGFNLRKEPFQDVVVRRAIRDLIQWDRIAEIMAPHGAPPVTEILSTGGEPLTEDEKAQAATVLRELPADLPPLFLAYPEGDAVRQALAEQIEADLERAGLTVTALGVETDLLLYTVFGRQRFDLYVWGMPWRDALCRYTWDEENVWGYGGTHTVGQGADDVRWGLRPMEDASSAPWVPVLVEDVPVVFLHAREEGVLLSSRVAAGPRYQFPLLGDILEWNWSLQAGN